MAYRLVGADGVEYLSEEKGTLGGHRRNRIYGRLDCAGAAWWIARGHYVKQRVFFADETTAIAAGYRPCARCMPQEYAAWKAQRR
jgi:methylphosphotriester-DNA--protein-cysteine methyltransferase